MVAFALTSGIPSASASYYQAPPGFRDPVAPLFPPGSSTGFVADAGGNSVGVFDETSSDPGGLVADPGGLVTAPEALALSSDGSRLFVADTGTDTIATVSVASETVTGTVSDPSSVVSAPSALACVSASTCYEANAATNTLGVIDASASPPAISATVTDSHFSAPVALGVAPGGGFLYVVDEAAGSLAVLDTSNNTVTGTIALGTDPVAIAVMEG